MEYYESQRDKIIFLDFDGVLNSEKDCFNGILDNLDCIHKLKDYLPMDEYITYVDLAWLSYDKIKLIKKICDETGGKIVVVSTFITHCCYEQVKEHLISLGLPIVGEITDSNFRGTEIRNYIRDCDIKNYIVIDDEIFKDYDGYTLIDDELYFTSDYSIIDHLIKTDFYDEGINEDLANDAIRLLKYQNNR